MKTILFLSAITLLFSCSTPSYMQLESGLVISGVHKTNDHFIVEAYAHDQKSDKKFVYFETDKLYNLYDTIWITQKK